MSHNTTMCAGFVFFWISYASLNVRSNPRNPPFDHLQNKFNTWKWKTKFISFLVTLKWSFGDFLDFFLNFEYPKPYSLELNSLQHRVTPQDRYYVDLSDSCQIRIIGTMSQHTRYAGGIVMIITTVLDGTHKRTYIQQRLTESRAKDTLQRSKITTEVK